MICAPLGRSGLRVSRIGLGMMSYGDPGDPSWALTEEQAEPIGRRAVEAGITFFDTADVYSAGASERITGRLLRKLFGRRADYVLATKVYCSAGVGPNDRGLSRKHILDGIDASLRRLGTDHVDLYQLHRCEVSDCRRRTRPTCRASPNRRFRRLYVRNRPTTRGPLRAGPFTGSTGTRRRRHPSSSGAIVSPACLSCSQ
jgi:aryl-alcohol dehydrogenase-like predicted oxidoreductase